MQVMRGWLLLLALWLVFVLALGARGQDAPPAPEIQQVGPHNTITLRAVGTPGHYTGFDLVADDLPVAPVRFTSHDLIWCAKAVATKNGLTSTLAFEDVQADPVCGLRLEHSRIVVTLHSEQYPTVAFDLHIAAFDPLLWQQTIGAQPFHFLTIGMPDAAVWHQEGWLFATPRADLFPLLLDPYEGAKSLSTTYNREWSRTPPLSAHALPVIGLWAPDRKVYAAWDFQATRLNARLNGLDDHSERDLATGFCNRLIVSTDPTLPPSQETVPPSAPLPDEDAPRGKNGLPPPKRDPRTRKPLSYMEQTSREYDRRGVSKFVALVAPNGGADSRQLVYPKPGTRLASQATLTFSANLPDTDDPNRFLWQQWWNAPEIQHNLPRVPRVVAAGGLSPSFDSQNWPAKSNYSLIVRAGEGAYLPGSLVFSDAGRRSATTGNASARQDDAAHLAWLRADASLLLKYAHYFQVDKEPCAYWNAPLAGEWMPAWGGEPTATLHNAQGWAAARRLLELYRLEKQQSAKRKTRQADKNKDGEPGEASAPDTITNPNPKVQNLIDGVFNWTKHLVWTRSGNEDEPALPTAKDGALAAAFLLDYYFTFRDDLLDGEHRTRALLALDLARSFTYRTLVLNVGETAEDTGAENKGEETFRWNFGVGDTETDADKASDAAGILDILAQVAVHTGDPILLWALQGSASCLSQTVSSATPPRNTPVPAVSAGDAQVLCGERAALVFNHNYNLNLNRSSSRNEDSRTLDGIQDGVLIASYRCTGAGDFAFTVHRVKTAGTFTASNAPISANVTFPYADLSLKPVAVRRGNVQQRVLQPGAELSRDSNTPCSLRVSGLRDGDTVIVGKPELSGAEKLPCAPPLLESVVPGAKRVFVPTAVRLQAPSPAPLSKITGTPRKQSKDVETKRRPARP